MLYLAFQTQADLMAPIRATAQAALTAATDGAWPSGLVPRPVTALWDMISRAGMTHHRPPYEIDTVTIGNEEVPVTEEATLTLPFGTLLRFAKEVSVEQPKVLIVAPLSGHFATLLRNTVKTMLPDHDVYITDWHNARDVSLDDGRFGFDDYIAYVIRFLQELGPGCHAVAVCQPCVQLLSAVALMSENNDPATPLSMTLMAGPVDTRVSPTSVNRLAKERDIGWFERNLIAKVPRRYPGKGRRVYPGFVQLSAFMQMNMDRHIKAHQDMYEQLARGENDKAEVTKHFYDEYFAVLDLPAEFYLETVSWVFQEHLLPKGELYWRGQKVNPAAIKKTSLLTVEGERDDICALGQTVAAHDLCKGLRPYMKRHHMQASVGHYGVFSGKRWDKEIYPIVKNTILGSM
jgi:poly(3-hydroxybutyrate) depolymerase